MSFGNVNSFWEFRKKRIRCLVESYLVPFGLALHGGLPQGAAQSSFAGNDSWLTISGL
jgi:hypothetical protein